MLRGDALSLLLLLAGRQAMRSMNWLPLTAQISEIVVRVYGVDGGRMGRQPVGVHPYPLAGADAGATAGINAHRAVATDALAVVDGQQNDVEDGLVGVGKQAHGGLPDGAAGAADVGAEDAVADRRRPRRPARRCPLPPFAADLNVQVGMDEPVGDGLDQLRRLAGVVQPTQGLADAEGLIGSRLQGRRLEVGGQPVEHLLIRRLDLGIVDGPRPLDILPQCLADVDEPNQLQTFLPGG